MHPSRFSCENFPSMDKLETTWDCSTRGTSWFSLTKNSPSFYNRSSTAREDSGLRVPIETWASFAVKYLQIRQRTPTSLDEQAIAPHPTRSATNSLWRWTSSPDEEYYCYNFLLSRRRSHWEKSIKTKIQKKFCKCCEVENLCADDTNHVENGKAE